MRFEPSPSESSADSDQDFDPTAEMLVNDFDDEHTLEEEEAMESAESVTNELDDLQREGEMPLNELLAMYGYESESAPSTANSSSTSKGTAAAAVTSKESQAPKSEPSTSSSSSKSNNSVATSRESASNTPASTAPPHPPPVTVKDDDEDDETEVITVPDDPPDPPSGTGPLLRSVCQASESSDTGTDDDYSPDEDWRKTIQVGSDYQATVPEGLCKYDDAPAYENEDRLLWDPSKLSDEQVEEYLRQSQQPFSSSAQGVNAIPVGSHIRDDEQALFLLLQCGHNVEEALRRRRMQPLHPADTMSLWSEDECRSFETGLKTYGKDFHLIQQNKVRTRSVGELVQFYYLWKKTERHDVFASRNRLEKKKYSLHPGTTDYMDRFLDEQENPPSHRDRSSSPSMHSLMFGDSRKRTPASSPPATITKLDMGSDLSLQQGGPIFHDTFYPVGPDKAGQLSSPSKTHPGNPLSDCSKELLNGQDRISAANIAKGSSTSSSTSIVTTTTTELPNSSSNNYPGNVSSPMYSERTSMIPPSDMLSCARHSSETSRLNDSRSDTCSSRFETCREVTSIE